MEDNYPQGTMKNRTVSASAPWTVEPGTKQIVERDLIQGAQLNMSVFFGTLQKA